MKHLGDITKISGYTAPIVDAIIGGSPCQDLSIAGKRAGLDGERSGLFMEQLRIIKEMRERDKHTGRTDVDIRPRYMVWENVPGAFSSNKGEDFRIVLEETAKVADKDASIPMPEKGKWTNSGCIMGDGWSIAWRILDAQFWGTSDKPLPQRRRRIALVADFGGESAPEILFVRQSLSGNIKPGKPKGKETPCIAPGSIGADHRLGADQYNAVILGDTVSTIGVNCGMSHGRQCVLEPVATNAYTLKIRSGCEGGGKGALIQEEKSATLSTLQDQTLFQPVYSIENHPADSRVDIDDSGKVQTLTSRMGTGGGNVPMVLECYSKSKRAQSATDFETWKESDTANTINTFDQGDVRTNELVVCVDQGGGKSACNVTEGQAPTLTCTHGGEPAVAYGIGAYHSNINGTLQSHPNGGASLNLNNVVRVRQGARYIVRRLTPLECERLQGYPDGWTDIGEWTDSNGKKRQTSDASRYKALGNSIALPPWKWVLKRLCACYERDATMASLFDGIGGFPYLWEQLNGKGSCLWASEIEEFPIAVTKVRFGE